MKEKKKTADGRQTTEDENLECRMMNSRRWPDASRSLSLSEGLKPRQRLQYLRRCLWTDRRPDKTPNRKYEMIRQGGHPDNHIRSNHYFFEKEIRNVEWPGKAEGAIRIR